MIVCDGHVDVQTLDNEIRRIEGQLDYLRRLRVGLHPTPDDLVEAPLIRKWRFAPRAATALRGNVDGHPYLRGPQILTSDVLVMDESCGYARTLSRIYRLGERAKDEGTTK